MTLANSYDVVVIGAGPAGLAAATQAARLGLATALLDEQASPGGQIYRAIAETPVRDRAVLGADYWRGETLLAPFRASGAAYVPGAMVWSVARSLEIGVSADGAARLIRAGHVILATGALERPMPIPGWTLPGVMTAGAGQIALKASGLVPEGRVVLAGTGPLLYLVAGQYLRAGAGIAALLDIMPRDNYRRALPWLPEFVFAPGYFRKGLRLLSEVRRRVRVIAGVGAIEARGADKLDTVAYRRNGESAEMAADLLLLHQGVAPNVNLSVAIGCDHAWDERQLCWKPVVDEWGHSSVAGVSIAGDGAGIGGAVAAEHRGTLAALGAARRLGRIGAQRLSKLSAAPLADRDRAMRGRAFLDALFQPPRWSRIPAGDTVVCRCEEVTARQVIETVAQGCPGPNQMKAFLRCGMGPCQGRLCGLTVTELIGEARGLPPSEIGYYRLRPPIKPITLGELASLPASAAAVEAVLGR